MKKLLILMIAFVTISMVTTSCEKEGFEDQKEFVFVPVLEPGNFPWKNAQIDQIYMESLASSPFSKGYLVIKGNDLDEVQEKVELCAEKFASLLQENGASIHFYGKIRIHGGNKTTGNNQRLYKDIWYSTTFGTFPVNDSSSPSGVVPIVKP